MSNLFKKVTGKDYERKMKEEEDRKQVERERLNAIVKKFYAWMESEKMTVKDATIVCESIKEALMKGMMIKVRPVKDAEEAKTITEFYAEADKAEKEEDRK